MDGGPKPKSKRLQVVNEVKLNCINHNINNELATRILFQMLDNYYEKGTTYINKKLTLTLRGDVDRYYSVNLYNRLHKKDVVVIKCNMGNNVMVPADVPLVEELTNGDCAAQTQCTDD